MVKADGVEGLSTRLLAHILMHNVWSKLVQHHGIRERLAHGLDTNWVKGVTQRVPETIFVCFGICLT